MKAFEAVQYKCVFDKTFSTVRRWLFVKPEVFHKGNE